MPNREAVAQLISAGGSWLPGVTKYHVTLEDLDSENSNRDELGTLHRDVIRCNVIHAQVTHIVDQTELVAICASIKEDATVQMTLFCPGRDESEPYVEATFYVSKADYDLIRYKDPGTGDVADWWQLNYTLVEV